MNRSVDLAELDLSELESTLADRGIERFHARQPHADAHRADMRHPLRKKTETIRQHLADDR